MLRIPALPALFCHRAAERSIHRNSRDVGRCIRQNGMKVKIFCATLIGLAGLIGAEAIQAASETALQKTATFAMGGVGYAGVMSEGERSLREILKEADAAARLESIMPKASAAGQLYALLGLRLRDHAAFQRVLEKYRGNDAKVATMRGCIMQRESFRKLLEEIERGEYDSFLAREWPEHKR
jgi:hypothetical protein